MERIFSTLIFFIVFLGCGLEAERNERRYIIENDTSKTIELFVFSIIDSGPVIINLRDRGDDVSKSVIQTAPFKDDYDISYVSQAYSVDSMVIVFDKTNFLNYTYDISENTFSSPLGRNIIRPENYTDIGNGNFLYKITQEDFERSEPCEDHCD